ncbi:MAG: hypothetical protein WBO34_01885 [Gammaproteobacteria bacterium]
MVNDKRKDDQASIEDLRAQLNAEQRMTLGELELLGWSLKFVRRPLFQDPVPVVVSDDNDEIGLLDPDGKIIIDKTRDYRHGLEAEADMGLTEETAGETAAKIVETSVEEVVMASEPEWMEKRSGEAPVPDNLEDYLNDVQVKALRQIENFGWELKFVRRPLFQEPIAVIINTDGDRVGTLEPDGRIDLHQNFDLREGTVDPENDDMTKPGVDKKQAS